jgi:hypothetical protein
MRQKMKATGSDALAFGQAICGAALLAAWERGIAEPPPVLTLLRAGYPGLTEEEAAALPLTWRDRALALLHQLSFGPVFLAVAPCESCSARLEFTLSAELLAASLQAAAAEGVLADGEVTARLRLANTRDLSDAAAAPDLEMARLRLLARCVEAVDRAGRVVALPQALHAAALDRLDAMHDAAEIAARLLCPACGVSQTVHLDIAGFLWAEVRHAARRLLDEVHELAWAYGWSESAILAMSAARRQAYLERVRG